MCSTLVELCAGTAAVSLWAMGRCRPLVGYMGSKRRDARLLCAMLGVEATQPTRCGLVDAGPWGDVWTTLRTAEGRGATREVLMRWDERGALPEMWPDLLYPPNQQDGAERAAQYLCLQARAAGCIPVWWSKRTHRWESPSGRGGCDLRRRMKPRGLVRIATIASRIGELERIDWGRVEVHHGDVGRVAPVPGSVVYFDPPYRGAPRYAALLSREEVLATAAKHAEVADLVIVSESEPLPLEGWHSRRLRTAGKPEWVTCSARVAVGEQLELLEGGP